LSASFRISTKAAELKPARKVQTAIFDCTFSRSVFAESTFSVDQHRMPFPFLKSWMDALSHTASPRSRQRVSFDVRNESRRPSLGSCPTTAITSESVTGPTRACKSSKNARKSSPPGAKGVRQSISRTLASGVRSRSPAISFAGCWVLLTMMVKGEGSRDEPADSFGNDAASCSAVLRPSGVSEAIFSSTFRSRGGWRISTISISASWVWQDL